MKKKLIYFALLALLFGAVAGTTFAANRVPQLTVDVVLQQDGSAHITQQFYAQTDEGTEFYLDYLDSGYLTITDFRVSDETGPYTVLPPDTWDVDASFEEKAGKCGILTIHDGVELCWGITGYGVRQYTVEYVLHGLVGAYTDADGFNHRFVNADMGFFPTDVQLTIRGADGLQLTDDFCDIWAFGFEGDIRFENGVILAETALPLEGDANMTIMLGMEKGVLTPARAVDKSFDDVKWWAFQGSDYADEERDEDKSELVAAGCFFGGIAVVCTVAATIDTRRRKKLQQSAQPHPGVPCGGDLNMAYVLGSKLRFIPDDNLLGARLLRLVSLGCVEPQLVAADTQNPPLRLRYQPDGSDPFDARLYDILCAAAGESDTLLPQDLERFCAQRENEKRLYQFVTDCGQDGLQSLRQSGCLKGRHCSGLSSLTPAGREQLLLLLGHQRWLTDFSNLPDMQIAETVLWREVMVYAVLFGIAEAVARQLAVIAPQQTDTWHYYGSSSIYIHYYNTCLYGAYTREYDRQASSGGGGSASGGGGGGFSGGGGGGTR